MLKPVCQGCGQPIWSNYLSALGATWHPEHFCCAGCGRPLGNEPFHLHNGAPFHSECYSRLIAPHCAYCG
ncbi:MAG TPA: LIM domain-containing protein, partial [Ktedonobacteraceae bacterium]